MQSLWSLDPACAALLRDNAAVCASKRAVQFPYKFIRPECVHSGIGERGITWNVVRKGHHENARVCFAHSRRDALLVGDWNGMSDDGSIEPLAAAKFWGVVRVVHRSYKIAMVLEEHCPGIQQWLGM